MKEQGKEKNLFPDESTPETVFLLKPDPRHAKGSINYLSTSAIKQHYYQASARRPGKAGESKAAVM